MEQLARARISMWQGGSLWLLETSRPNPETTPRTDFHAHHAIQIVLSLGGRFCLWLADAELAAPFAAVAPDARHSFDADGAYAILFVEPESPAGRSFVADAFDEGDLQVLPAAVVDRLGPQLAALARRPPPTLEELASLGREMIERIAGSDERPPLDPRIRRVIARAARDPDAPPRRWPTSPASRACRLAGSVICLSSRPAWPSRPTFCG